MRQHRDLGPWEWLSSLDELIDGLHERLDGAVRVVAGDVVVELLPEPLDHVRLRRVGRQEVEHDAPAEPGQMTQRLPDHSGDHRDDDRRCGQRDPAHAPVVTDYEIKGHQAREELDREGCEV